MVVLPPLPAKGGWYMGRHYPISVRTKLTNNEVDRGRGGREKGHLLNVDAGS